MVKFSSSLTDKDISVVCESTLNAISLAAENSNNPNVIITSTLRPPIRQARAMYDNIKSGLIISYATPGRIVTKLCKDMIEDKKPADEIIAAMTSKIEELSETGQRVSRHCVSETEYCKLNIVDVSVQKHNMPNPRDFVNELLKDTKVSKIITKVGYKSTYNNDIRVIIDDSEPAIHIEYKTI